MGCSPCPQTEVFYISMPDMEVDELSEKNDPKMKTIIKVSKEERGIFYMQKTKYIIKTRQKMVQISRFALGTVINFRAVTI
jgi:hypothetical protein